MTMNPESIAMGKWKEHLRMKPQASRVKFVKSNLSAGKSPYLPYLFKNPDFARQTA